MDGKIIGFDCSGHTISMVVVTYGKGEYRLAACETVSVANSDEWQDVAEAVARIQQQVDLRDAVCIAGLPDDWISRRKISMPFADRKKINKIIAYEIEPLLPYPIDDLIIDYQPLAVSQVPEDGHPFLTAVIARTRLKDFIEKLNALGLEPEIVTPRGIAVAAVLSAHQDAGLFVEGDDRFLTAGTFSRGGVRSVNSLPFSGQAEDLKAVLVDTLHYMLLADDERHQADFEPEAVYLADDLYRRDGVKEAVAASLGSKVLRLQTVAAADLSTEAFTEDKNRMISGIDVALCLTRLKQVHKPFINFRKDEFAISGKWRQYSDIIIKTGLLAALVIIIWLSGFFYDLKQVRERIAAVEARKMEIFKETFPGVPVVDDPFLQMKAEAERLAGKIGLPPEMDRKAYCVDILNDISRFVPADSDVVIERLVVGPDDVVLSGSTDSFNAVNTLKSEFGKSALFGKIDISTATMSKIDKRVSFKLRLELR